MYIKIIRFVLTKLELSLSKKENKIAEKNNISEKLLLYRNILDLIDSYNGRINDTITLRHYRYLEFKLGKSDDNV